MLNNLKPALIYLGVSLVLVFGAKYLTFLLIYLDIAYLKLSLFINTFTDAFNLPPTFNRVISLALLPVLITMIPALIYRLVKKKQMPHTMTVIWLIWLVVALSKILLI